MDEDLVQRICDAVRETAEANGVAESQLHAVVDAVVLEVKTNLETYVDEVCKKRWF